jgi:ketosteroid isomerase-like protein
MKANTVESVMKNFARAYSKRDLKAMRGLFAPHREVVLYSANEKRVGPAAIEAQMMHDWAHTDTLSLDWDWTNITTIGDVAWAACDMNMKIKSNGKKASGAGRASFVFENTPQGWCIAHAHFSYPTTLKTYVDSPLLAR